jgi:hypothetical protein
MVILVCRSQFRHAEIEDNCLINNKRTLKNSPLFCLNHDSLDSWILGIKNHVLVFCFCLFLLHKGEGGRRPDEGEGAMILQHFPLTLTLSLMERGCFDVVAEDGIYQVNP